MPALLDRLAPYRVTGFRPARPVGLWSALATIACDATTDPVPVTDASGGDEGRSRAARRAILDHLAGLQASVPGGAEVVVLDDLRLRRAV